MEPALRHAATHRWYGNSRLLCRRGLSTHKLFLLLKADECRDHNAVAKSPSTPCEWRCSKAATKCARRIAFTRLLFEVVFTAMQAERSFYMTRAQRHVAKTDTYGRTAGTIYTLISSSSAAIRATRTTELSRYVKCDKGLRAEASSRLRRR